MKVTRTLLAIGLLATLPLLRAQDENSSSKPEKAPSAEKGGRGKGRGMSVEQRVDRLSEQLNLTDDQKAKIKAIYEKAQADMEAVPQEERREKMRSMMQETNKEIRAVLTEEQQKKFDEISQRRVRNGGKKKKDAE